jgi:hypothetical protein
MPSFLDLMLPSADGIGAGLAMCSTGGSRGRLEKTDEVSRIEMSESQVMCGCVTKGLGVGTRLA